MDLPDAEAQPMVNCVPPGLPNLGNRPEQILREAPKPAYADVAAVVKSASTQLTLPEPYPHVGPDPSVNKWNTVAVRYPIWLWNEGPTEMSTSVALEGHTLTINATWAGTSYNMGDGSKPVECTKNVAWTKAVTPGDPSPACGFIYYEEPPRETAVITATSVWNVTWEGAGHTGKFQVTRQAQRAITVKELRAVVIAKGEG